MIQNLITAILIAAALFYLIFKRRSKKKTECKDKQCNDCPLKKECGKKS